MYMHPNPLRDEDIPTLSEAQIDRLVAALIDEHPSAATTPRRPRTSRRWIALAGVAGATVAMLLVSVLGPSSVAPTAAAWTAMPSPLPQDRTATVLAQCQQMVGTGGNTKVAIAEQRGRSAAVVLENDAMCIGFADDVPGGGGMAGGWQDVTLVHPTGDDVNVVYSDMAGGTTMPSTFGDERTQHWVAIVVAVEAEVGPEVTHGEVILTDGEVVTATVDNGWLLAWWPKGIAPVRLITHSAHGIKSTPVTANPASWASPTN